MSILINVFRILSYSLLFFLILVFQSCHKKIDNNGADNSTPIDRIKIHISKFMGTHLMKGERICWGGAAACDTIIETQIELSMQSDMVTVYEPFTNLNGPHVYDTNLSSQNRLVYATKPKTSSGSTVTFDLTTDKIFLSNCQCGLGGGARWKFESK